MANSVSVAIWSQKKLNSAQCRLLTKGLKFVPTKRNVDIGKLIASLSPIFEIKIIASYSKMQEAHLYAKFKGEIYTPYIGISLVFGISCRSVSGHDTSSCHVTQSDHVS
jgi:hypothetical protein